MILIILQRLCEAGENHEVRQAVGLHGDYGWRLGNPEGKDCPGIPGSFRHTEWLVEAMARLTVAGMRIYDTSHTEGEDETTESSQKATSHIKIYGCTLSDVQIGWKRATLQKESLL